MKKTVCLLTALLLLLTLSACIPEDEFVVNSCPCSVMVGGEVFHTYHEKSSMDPDTIQPAGKITHASCNISAIPQQNDTSNFETCVGQPYAWVDGDLILFYQNQWNICYRTDEVGGSYKIMVNGVLYYTFSKPAPTPTDDQITGKIETCTEGLWVYPTENDQTNHEPFVGQPYAFVDGKLVLFYNDQWNTCKPFSELEPSETEPTAAPTTEPTTAPTTEPAAEPVLDWDIPDYPQLSYDEYFSETRYYYYAAAGESPKEQYFWGGWRNRNDKCEVWIADGKILAGSSITGRYVQVCENPDDDIMVTCCDELWIYAIKDRTELFRMDYNGENRQTLYVDETQKIAPFDITYTHVRDGCVFFFVAAAGSDYGIYRLYLPDMTLDLLYTTEDKPFLYGPYSNFEITWSCNVREPVDNVYEIDYYYNCLTGELLERPVYGDRSWGNTTWAWWLEE